MSDHEPPHFSTDEQLEETLDEIAAKLPEDDDLFARFDASPPTSETEPESTRKIHESIMLAILGLDSTDANVIQKIIHSLPPENASLSGAQEALSNMAMRIEHIATDDDIAKVRQLENLAHYSNKVAFYMGSSAPYRRARVQAEIRKSSLPEDAKRALIDTAQDLLPKDADD